MHRRQSQRGFTLIELMTVLAIIGLLTFSLASLSAGSGAGTPQTFAERVTGLIQLGRLRAEARRSTHEIRMSTTSIALYESGAATPGLKVYQQVNETLVQSIDVPSGVAVAGFNPTTQAGTGITPTGTSLTFDIRADGQSPTGGTIYLTDNNLDKFRVFVYTVTGAALAREGW